MTKNMFFYNALHCTFSKTMNMFFELMTTKIFKIIDPDNNETTKDRKITILLLKRTIQDVWTYVHDNMFFLVIQPFFQKEIVLKY